MSAKQTKQGRMTIPQPVVEPPLPKVEVQTGEDIVHWTRWPRIEWIKLAVGGFVWMVVNTAIITWVTANQVNQIKNQNEAIAQEIADRETEDRRIREDFLLALKDIKERLVESDKRTSANDVALGNALLEVTKELGFIKGRVSTP